MNNSSFDPRDFRQALGQFPTGVTVITARGPEGRPMGMTASSFNTVSIDPALILWSVDKSAYFADILGESTYFAVNVLSAEQAGISNKFASKNTDKFDGIEFTNGLGDAPLLANCIAQFECKTWQLYEGGDHIIVVGEVMAYKSDASLSPLVFSQGTYASTAALDLA